MLQMTVDRVNVFWDLGERHEKHTQRERESERANRTKEITGIITEIKFYTTRKYAM